MTGRRLLNAVAAMAVAIALSPQGAAGQVALATTAQTALQITVGEATRLVDRWNALDPATRTRMLCAGTRGKLPGRA